MRTPVEIEDIEEMRRKEGIEDTELREQIRGLRPGDLVKLTFLFGERSCETVSVRITSIKGTAFRGKLDGRPVLAGLAEVRTESVVSFTAAHIHSVFKKLSSSRK